MTCKNIQSMEIWNPPPRKLIVEWTIDTRNKLVEDIIEKLFKAFVLNLNINGSGDSHINCFKQDQPGAVGYEKLQWQLHVMKVSTF